ncbi:MAG: hypothetical protein HY231_09220 [Acidobacteria bacterium]|nr:hypothetical protein [Acidobacteriota bacterium]
MNYQGLFGSPLTGLPIDIGIVEKRNSTQTPANINPLGIIGLQEVGAKSKPYKARVESPIPLSDQLAHNVAIFPKTDRVKITKDGVYIPQNILGENVEIEHQENCYADGSVQVTIFSYPRHRKAKVREVKTIDCTLELKWLDEYRDQYIGTWVALKGSQLLSYGENAREVYEAARKAGVESPVLIQVEPKNDLPFGGW